MSSGAGPRRAGGARVWRVVLTGAVALLLLSMDASPIHASSSDRSSLAGRSGTASFTSKPGVAVFGCAAVVAPDVCELPWRERRTIAVWLPDAEGRADAVQVGTRGAALVAARPAREFATGLRVDVSVELTGESGGLDVAVAGERALSLSLGRAPSWAWQAEVRAATSAETLARLERVLARAKGAERSKLLRAVAESQLALGQRSQAFASLEAGAGTAMQAQRDSEARSHLLRAAYHHATTHQFDAAETALARARTVQSFVIDGDGEAAIAYVSAYLQTRLRDLPGAAREYERAQVWVARGAELMAPQIASGAAQIAEQQGRINDAIQLLNGALASNLAANDPCFRALVMSRLGWNELELHRQTANTPELPAALTRLRQAVSIYESECHKAPQDEPALAMVYLGLASLKAKSPRDARVEFQRLRSFVLAPRVRLWQELLGAELLLAEGNPPAAQRAFRALEAHAIQLLAPDFAWQAREGAARAAVAAGQLDVALGDFERAEALLASALDWVPLDAGGLRSMRVHAGPVEGHAATLLSAGRISEAFEVLRRARRRVLVRLASDGALSTSSEWREAWHSYLTARDEVERRTLELEAQPSADRSLAASLLAASELRAQQASAVLTELLRQSRRSDAPSTVARDEALLLWTQIQGAWHGFLRQGERVAHVVSAVPPSGQDWLAPFANSLAQARRLRVLAEGALAEVDIHTLARQSFPELRVSYSLDLGVRLDSTTGVGTVLAGDADGDLPHARQELELIAQQLRTHGASVELLLGGELGATQLREAAARAHRLHYAGHATFIGDDGWRSRLQVAHGEITPAEILSWPTVPEEVVLSACEAAHDAGLLHAQGVGLAQAFLLAGSRVVVAPSRRISDRAARRFSLELWRRLAEGATLEGAYFATRTVLEGDDEMEAFRLLRL